MSFVNRPTITLSPNNAQKPLTTHDVGSWIAVIATPAPGATPTAIVIRPLDIVAVDVRHQRDDQWRAALYVRGVSMTFNVDGDLAATKALVEALQLPLVLGHITEEKL